MEHKAPGRRWVDALAPVGFAAMVIGAWGPWAAHVNAAMSLGVIDLAEFVKFMARAGLTSIVREWFYLPLLAAAVGLSIWSARQAAAWPRLLIASAAALLTLTALPPFQYPDFIGGYLTPENRLLFLTSMAALVSVLAGALVGRYIPRQAVEIAIIVLGLGSVSIAAWQLIRLNEPLSELYGAPVHVGWGAITTVAGGLLAAAGGALKLASR